MTRSARSRSARRCLEKLRRQAQRLARACDGTTSIEVAFLLPGFVLFIFGAVEFGSLLWTRATLQASVEAAARCAAINKTLCGSASDVQTYAAAHTTGLSVSSTSFVVTQPTCGHQVSVSYSFRFIPPGLIPGTVALSAQSCHP